MQLTVSAEVLSTAEQLAAVTLPDWCGQHWHDADMGHVRAAVLKYCREEVLPLAQPLAAANEAYHGQPEQQAAVQLAAAQAAATRSCAYLRCANMAACGGPGAGEGQGSKRCGACKAVW